jgi:F0F1-type ATP synthase epsilon subunit
MMSIIPAQMPESGYIIEQGMIKISVGKGLLQIVGNEITVLTSVSITSTSQSKEILAQMKVDMEEQLAKIKEEGNAEELEIALIQMEKI